MTVKELIQILQQYPESARVVTTRYSEFRDMVAEDIEIVRVYNNGGYLSLVYRQKDDARAFEAVHFVGN